jgi:hypothetical protein
MTPYECYTDYLALKQHFTRRDYDYLKYRGKMRVNTESFQKRKDKIFFEKLSKHPDVHDFLVANLSQNSKLWIRDLAYSDEAEKTYQSWKKRQQSLSYVFKNETQEHMQKPFNDNFLCREGEHPHLLMTYLSGSLCLETLCILLELTGAKKYWDSKMKYDIIWEEYSLRVNKYTPLINYDKDKFKKIVVDIYA